MNSMNRVVLQIILLIVYAVIALLIVFNFGAIALFSLVVGSILTLSYTSLMTE